ncbi:MAG: alpha/beta fold hydrolase [Aquincola tertiaricarbonis]
MKRGSADPPSAAGSWALRLLGGLLICTALAVSLSRAPDRAPESLVARWAPPPSQFIELAGQVVHLRDEGHPQDPLPVLMLHDLGNSLHTWSAWAPRLARQRRVVSVDLPGAGLTGPQPEADYRLSTQARFVLALMDRLQLRQVQLVGHGRGGEVALELAAQAPSRVERLLLLNPGSGPILARRTPPLFLVARLPVLHWLAESLLPRALVQAHLAALVARPDRLSAEQVDRHFELLLREGNRRALHEQLLQVQAEAHAQDAAATDGNGSPARDATRQLPMPMPVQVMWGQQNRWMPGDRAARVTASIPNAVLVRLPEAGHLPQEEDLPSALDAARAFLGA